MYGGDESRCRGKLLHMGQSLKVRSILHTAYLSVPRLRDRRSDQPFPQQKTRGEQVRLLAGSIVFASAMVFGVINPSIGCRPNRIPDGCCSNASRRQECSSPQDRRCTIWRVAPQVRRRGLLTGVRAYVRRVVHMGRIGIVIPVALLVLTGCTSATSTGGRVTVSKTPHETTSSGTPSAAPSVNVDPRVPPQLPDAQKTFIKTGGKTGPHAFPEIPQVQRGTLEVGVICSGSGTIDVNIGSLVSYTVVCGNGHPGQFNEVGLRHSHRNVSVSVTTKTKGSWGLSVGWAKIIDPPG